MCKCVTRADLDKLDFHIGDSGSDEAHQNKLRIISLCRWIHHILMP